MRLFIAINFNEEIKNHLMDAIQKLKQSSVKGNFTQRDNLHLTLVFIGEVGTDKVDQIKSVINRVKSESFDLAFGGIGRFKRKGSEIYWVGVEKNEMLYSINNQLTEELRIEGFDIEKREFKPHLTLGREVIVKDSFHQDNLAELLPNMNMNVNRISLMKSERIKGILTYTDIYGKSLG